jgi:hypothetical protein
MVSAAEVVIYKVIANNLKPMGEVLKSATQDVERGQAILDLADKFKIRHTLTTEF